MLGLCHLHPQQNAGGGGVFGAGMIDAKYLK